MAGDETSDGDPVVVLVDDVRSFRDGRDCQVARTCDEASALLRRLEHVDELWLDYDMGGGRTVGPVIDTLEGLARDRGASWVGRIFVHTSSPTGAVELMRRLTAVGYAVERTRTVGIWTW